MTATIMYARRSTGSACRSRRASRISASASARRCWRGTSAPRWRRIPKALVEIGYYPIRATEAGAGLFGASADGAEVWPDHVYHWHREGFALAHGAELLAQGRTFPNQAFRYGPCAYGIQFHPEVTHQMMCRWTVKGGERLNLPNARPRSAHFFDRLQYDARVRRWLDAFIDHWVAGSLAGRFAA